MRVFSKLLCLPVNGELLPKWGCGSRSIRTGQRACLGTRRFSGAAAIWPRKGFDVSRFDTSRRASTGAAALEPRKVENGTDHTRRILASMGPRRWSRGKMLTDS
jgi:hypothetical protein